jgi:hypothetical protein
LSRPASIRDRYSRRIAALCAAVACALAAIVVPAVAASLQRTAKSPQHMMLYSVATGEQFLRYSDDRQRGYGNNPFGNFKDTKAQINRHKNGPLPGDIDDFEFNVFTGADLKHRVGTAKITCQYNFNLLAFCDATYELGNGTILGAGQIDFKTSSFKIAVTGGTGAYQGRTGELDSTPATNRAQRLAITLTS